ncbi:molecular chaperone DjiA [Cohaesibacter celericrescens]|uniref:Molecular chaperone DjlA n=1 Tax=Cohaesibacter celericrescens TaxID=2067669 RepID=A0A2N5XWT0_9HYPH|nr:molecular chaperone DjiA [Cohaesibacter celericrescens]PLW75559.1 molecular chaperone DjlA [Cohaesibacter celericrescens]PLW78966.1 molecular chaperone DjlA [Cohaesibacter celericrescens]
MSIWSQIGSLIDDIRHSETLAFVVEKMASAVKTVGDRFDRKQLTFTVAMIALSAKMAKADGVVTQDEINVFQTMFEIPEGEERNVVRMFNLFKQDVAGYESYAKQIAALYEDEPEALEDIIDGLFLIAGADGVMHSREMMYLERVSEIFCISDRSFLRIKMQHVKPDEQDPYTILAADRSMSDKELKSHYRKLVRENHPDSMIARGVPEEFVRISTEKLASINNAWSLIVIERGLR